MAFRGAYHFSRFAAFAIGGALIATPTVGIWPWPAVAIALYLVLSFYNQLETRDLRESRDTRRRKPRQSSN